jgi:hypothetical protein
VERDVVTGGHGPHQLEGLLDQRAQRDRLGRDADGPGLDPGEIHDLVDEGEQMLARDVDHARPPVRLLPQLTRAEQLAEAEDGGKRRAQLVAHPRQELVLGLARLAQLGICDLKLLRPAQDLCLHPLTALAQLDELGHVLDPVDDVPDAAQVVQDGRVHRAPVAHLEPAALGIRPPDVVLLHGHRVGPAGLAHPLERRAQVADAGRRRIVGVVGEDVEDAPSQDVVAADHGRSHVRVAHRGDAEVGVEDQERARCSLEQRPEVNALAAHLTASP